MTILETKELIGQTRITSIGKVTFNELGLYDCADEDVNEALTAFGGRVWVKGQNPDYRLEEKENNNVEDIRKYRDLSEKLAKEISVSKATILDLNSELTKLKTANKQYSSDLLNVRAELEQSKVELSKALENAKDEVIEKKEVDVIEETPEQKKIRANLEDKEAEDLRALLIAHNGKTKAQVKNLTVKKMVDIMMAQIIKEEAEESQE